MQQPGWQDYNTELSQSSDRDKQFAQLPNFNLSKLTINDKKALVDYTIIENALNKIEEFEREYRVNFDKNHYENTEI